MFKMEAWHMAAAEEAGYGTTNNALINKVANYLVKNCSGDIGYDEFVHVCYTCGVDPDSFNDSDYDQLQRRLNELV